MALIDSVEETQRCVVFSYFQQSISNSKNPVLDMVAAGVAKKLFAAPYDNDNPESEGLRDAIFGPIAQKLGAAPASEEYRDIKRYELPENLAAEIAVLNVALDQHLELHSKSNYAPRTSASLKTSQSFNSIPAPSFKQS